jgi:hypothetical protein
VWAAEGDREIATALEIIRQAAGRERPEPADGPQMSG